MFKSIVKELQHNEIFAIISLVIFLSVFIGAVIYAYTIRKELVETIKNIPLDLEKEDDINQKL